MEDNVPALEAVISQKAQGNSWAGFVTLDISDGSGSRSVSHMVADISVEPFTPNTDARGVQ